MQFWKCLLSELWLKKKQIKKEQEETEKPQHFIVTENKLFKGFTAEDV